MPVDLVMERSLIEAGEPTALRVQAAPGGFYTRPAPVERDAAISASIQVEFELKGGDGKSWLKENRELNVTAPMDIDLSPSHCRSDGMNLLLRCVSRNAVIAGHS